jgi:hypothetical protein
MKTISKEIKLADLRIGDEILMYVKRREGGSSMGPGVEGNEDYLTRMVYAGNVYTDTTGSAYFWDGEALGIPITERDIKEVVPQGGIKVIREIYLQKSREHGGHFTRTYMNLFEKSPFEDGEHVMTNHNYGKENRVFTIRNNHKILRANDLIYQGNQGRIAIVWSPSLHSKTLVSIHALRIQKNHEP